MQAVVAKGWGRGLQLELGSVREPSCGPHDLLVRVKAASVNPKDFKLNVNLGRLAAPVPARLMKPLFGDDLAGVVVAKGSAVTRFEVGDAVYGMDMHLRTASLAELAVISQRRVAHKPSSLEFQQAAALPLAAQTALQGLRIGRAQPGSRVLLIGVGGGVGTLAIQIAKAMGCHVTGICSTRNIERAKSLGADEVIDYTLGDYRHSAGSFDVVFDITSFESPKSCRLLMGDKGHFVSTFGQSAGLFGTFLDFTGRSHFVKVQSYTEDLALLNQWIEKGLLKPVIDAVYPLKEAQHAYDYVKSGKAQGKVVINVEQ